MKNKILVALGIFFGFLPVYAFSGWIYVFNKFHEVSHEDKQDIFFEKIMFGINFTSNLFFQIIIILFGLISVVIFILLISSLKQNSNKKKSKIYFILYLMLLIIVSIFTILNFIGLM
jgi:hypothetical protein